VRSAPAAVRRRRLGRTQIRSDVTSSHPSLPTRIGPAIGFVKPGQHVRLRFDAFPYQRFGAYGGTIAQVANSMARPGELLTPVTLKEPAYRIKVALDRQTIDAFGREVPLEPDMTVHADIVLDQRSMLQWLLEPLLAARHQFS